MGQRAIVIGGGIAGLAAATSLLQAGWQVQVLERAPELGEVGAGLAVTVNGMRALAAIGAADAVQRAGYAVRPAGTRRADGRWLLRAPESPDDELSRMVGIHRRLLHESLAAAAGAADLVTGAQVTAIYPGTPGAEQAKVFWGTQTAIADLVVGADGLRSAARDVLFPGHRLAYSGYSSWRAIVADSTTEADRFAMVWGRRAEFGALRISAEHIYWYGYVGLPAGHRFPDELRAVGERFGAWAPDVRALITATRPADLIRHDVWQLKQRLPRYTRGRTVLIGDAAHPMLPTLGQGANSALEDGASLGPLLPAGGELMTGLRNYENARYRRTGQLVSRSAQMARAGAHLGRGQALRDAVLRVTPARAAQRSGTRILDWWPPAS